MKTTKTYITWDNIHKDSIELAERISKQVDDLKGILAISRGGLVPAGIISYKLGIKNVETICLSSYNDSDQLVSTELISDPAYYKIGDGSGWMVIDDLYDTGSTYDRIKQLFPSSKFAALYSKNDDAHDKIIYVAKYFEFLWLVFPWDNEC